MKIWLDAQLSPAMAVWISAEFQVSVVAVRDLGYREAKNREIFFAARQAGGVVMTKDKDFVRLVEELGSPPSGYLAHVWQHFQHSTEGNFKADVRQGHRTDPSRRAVVEINAA